MRNKIEAIFNNQLDLHSKNQSRRNYGHYLIDHPHPSTYRGISRLAAQPQLGVVSDRWTRLSSHHRSHFSLAWSNLVLCQKFRFLPSRSAPNAISTPRSQPVTRLAPSLGIFVLKEIRITPHLAELKLEETLVKILLRQGIRRSIRHELLV
jgi:hypothetical protein